MTDKKEAPVPGTPEYDAAMIKKAEEFDNLPSGEKSPAADTGAQDDKPQLILGKFKDQAALEAAYTELEKKQGAQSKDAPKDDKAAPAADPAKDGKAAEDAAKEALKGSNVDFDGMAAKYAKNGSLEDADYAALEKAGISRAMVDAYIDGQQARADQLTTDIQGVVGGKAQYDSLMQWAAKNLSQDEIVAFNGLTDVRSIKMAVQGINARMVAANGSDPKLLGGKTPAADVYRSTAEMQSDMKDPRYKTDPAFREEVMAKLSRSNIEI